MSAETRLTLFLEKNQRRGEEKHITISSIIWPKWTHYK